jgi:hypothetical protein
LNFFIPYLSSIYLRLATIFVALTGATGLGVSVYFVCASWPLAIASAGCGAWVLLNRFELQKSFSQPNAMYWREEGKQVAVYLDDKEVHLDRLWATPLCLVITGTIKDTTDDTSNGIEKRRDVRVMLGKDAMSDNCWHSLQMWRVWRQRGV